MLNFGDFVRWSLVFEGSFVNPDEKFLFKLCVCVCFSIMSVTFREL